MSLILTAMVLVFLIAMLVLIHWIWPATMSEERVVPNSYVEAEADK